MACHVRRVAWRWRGEHLPIRFAVDMASQVPTTRNSFDELSKAKPHSYSHWHLTYRFQSGKVPPMNPVRFGVVGVGGMGGHHAKTLSEMPEVQLVAVADLNPDTAQRVASETGARAFSDSRALLGSGVEAVLIATPHPFHAAVTREAARRGVHVLSEKPLAVSASEADAMIAQCDEAGVLLGVMFQQRTNGARLAMREMIQRGELGELHRISMTAPWYRTQAYYDSGSWRGTWKGEGGGILMNQAPHSLDQFVWLFGRSPSSVHAICDTRLHTIEVENVAVALCDYRRGVTGQFYASTSDVPSGERVEIAGDRGLLVHDERGLRFLELRTPLSQHLREAAGGFEAPEREWRTIEHPADAETHVKVVAAFARAVRENDASLLVANGRDGLAALELANAILLAGATRREVSLPLARAAFDDLLRALQNGERTLSGHSEGRV